MDANSKTQLAIFIAMAFADGFAVGFHNGVTAAITSQSTGIMPTEAEVYTQRFEEFMKWREDKLAAAPQAILGFPSPSGMVH